MFVTPSMIKIVKVAPCSFGAYEINAFSVKGALHRGCARGRTERLRSQTRWPRLDRLSQCVGSPTRKLRANSIRTGWRVACPPVRQLAEVYSVGDQWSANDAKDHFAE